MLTPLPEAKTTFYKYTSLLFKDALNYPKVSSLAKNIISHLKMETLPQQYYYNIFIFFCNREKDEF